MVHYGFELSEKMETPVLLRITTRLAHSRSGVTTREALPQNSVKLPGDTMQFILLPAFARKRYRKLLDLQKPFEEAAEQSSFNQYIDKGDHKLGIISCGITYNYLLENFPGGEVPYPVLKISHYPVSEKLIRKIYKDCDELLIIEEGYPLIEEMLKGLLAEGKRIHGRLDGTLPRTGELNPQLIGAALNVKYDIAFTVPETLTNRPPKLCDGCAHNDAFKAINEVMLEYGKGRVFSDIGCYTLSALKPLESINSCVDMGASITMAIGAADAGLVPAIAAIGDSTFTHSGITGLLDAVNNKSPITVFILDNSTTAMTGGQESSAHGKIEDICKGVGVEEDHIRVIKPLKKHHEENVNIIREELAYNGVSVIIPRRECIQTLNRRMRAKHKAKKLQT
jgi:indolepyruvate ferredoxin oxidoreductase alpha subunit